MSNKIKDMMMEIDMLKNLIEKLPKSDKMQILKYIDETSENALKEVNEILDNVDEEQVNEFINELGKVDIKFDESKK
tara:strand:+ start:591 stop:821 length:231 start_codon:yes stop_codon:yes gene_type:complete